MNGYPGQSRIAPRDCTLASCARSDGGRPERPTTVTVPLARAMPNAPATSACAASAAASVSQAEPERSAEHVERATRVTWAPPG